MVDGFDPCVVLLNNDLSGGVPNVLRGVNKQALFPPLHGGWATRRKSNHFDAYKEVVTEFAQVVASIRGSSTPISRNAAGSISVNGR